MAPPMPPDAPVTSAVLPERSNIVSNPFLPSEAGEVAEGRRGHEMRARRAAHDPSVRRADTSPRKAWGGERKSIQHYLRRLEKGFDVGRRVERQAGHVLVDAFHQAREHLAGTAFDQHLDALGLHVLHALVPPHEPS